MVEASPLLQLNTISKSFPGVKALSEVSLELDRGEIVAVVGENGAGKSTLMKILAGIYSADQGTVLLDGKPSEKGGVREAMRKGISLIHQELNLAENLSIAENIFLGCQPHRGPGWLPFTNRREMYQRASELLDELNLSVSPNTLISRLSIAQRQLVEIAKALSKNPRILVFDEPTSSLSLTEADRLLELIQQLRDRGVAILYVTHHLREVVRLADRVAVLRDGQHVGTLGRDEISQQRMISLMIGRDIKQFYQHESHATQERPVMLEVQNFRREQAPASINFRIHEGEVVGFAGLVGAGRTELAHGIFGIDKDWSGAVAIDGQTAQVNNPTQAIKAGLALVPEDRKRYGLLLSMALWFNICLTVLGRLSRFGWRNRDAESDLTDRMIAELDVRATNAYQTVGLLSGGNQQKVVLGKWLATKPKVLLLDEPTRGIDVGAKSEIYRLISDLAKSGVAVMMISSEMEEIVGISDRVIVMREGSIAGELHYDEIDEQSVLALAIGSSTTRTQVQK